MVKSHDAAEGCQGPWPCSNRSLCQCPWLILETVETSLVWAAAWEHRDFQGLWLLTLPFTSCGSQNNKPCTSPGSRGAGSGGMSMGEGCSLGWVNQGRAEELTLVVQIQEIWPTHQLSYHPTPQDWIHCLYSQPTPFPLCLEHLAKFPKALFTMQHPFDCVPTINTKKASI